MVLVPLSFGNGARTCVLGIMAIGASFGCARNAAMNASAIPVSHDSHDDRVEVDDTFTVRVYGEPDLSGDYRVATDGTIDFPLAGRVPVQGLGVGQIQQEIVKRLKGGYLLDPQVTVMIKDWKSRKVSVLGQVTHPGPVPYFPNMTIVDAIASAGGFTGVAAKNSVNLRREVTGKVETRTLPVADITEGRSPNVVVLPGDVLVVEERLF
jgi:protein involved in polysaccharide export with SLBB domain